MVSVSVSKPAKHSITESTDEIVVY